MIIKYKKENMIYAIRCCGYTALRATGTCDTNYFITSLKTIKND